MPLTNEQIETLFAFTKKKSVQYYDLQVELVDHLASSIEEEMEKDAKLPFDAALQKVYSRFGIFGFAHVVQERERSLIKQGRKLLWTTFKSYFSIPKIAFTILLFVSTYLLAPFLPGLFQRVILAAILLYMAIVNRIAIKQRRKEDTKPLLLTLGTTYFIPFSLWQVFILPNVFELNAPPVNSIVFASLVSAIIVLHLSAVQIDKQVRQKAKELYPEAFSIA